jgi:hypothetical protein
MLKKAAAFLAAVSFLTVGCGVQNTRSDAGLESLVIPQSPVQSQGRMGFCWAYAQTGLIESVYKTQTGKTVDLSEEVIAMYHMAHAIRKMYRSNMGVMELWSAFSRDKLPEGWSMRLTPWTQPLDFNEDDIDGLDITKRYGLWPESAWNLKVATAEERDAMNSAIAQRARSYINSVDKDTITVDDVIENVLVGPPGFGFPSKPPQEFVYDGVTYTPHTFLKALNFNPDNFVAVEGLGQSDYTKVVASAKRALIRGLAVPLGFPINISRLKGDTFTGVGVPSQTLGDLVNFTREGGHLVLATDFVNEGGVEGATTVHRLRQEMMRDPYSLDYLVFKNSWGLGAKTNEAGIKIGGSDSGYYKIDREYLMAASKVGKYKGWTPLTVIVPKDIADFPFGYEPISDIVTNNSVTEAN